MLSSLLSNNTIERISNTGQLSDDFVWSSSVTRSTAEPVILHGNKAKKQETTQKRKIITEDTCIQIVGTDDSMVDRI